MSDGLPLPELVDETDSVITGRHPVRASLPILAAPTDSSRPAALNTHRRPFVTVACSSLKDHSFAFDSSFISPNVVAGKAFINFASMVKAFPKSPIAIFGHADPSGDLHYNQVLSGRRAKAVFALLTRNVDMWEELFDPAQRGLAVGDEWGTRSIQIMLQQLGFRDKNLTNNGKLDEETRAAIKAFQSAPILLPEGRVSAPIAPATGASDRPTRRRLFTVYMNAICQDASGADFRLPTTVFLRDGKTPGGFQGCGEFNPRRLPSQETIKTWKDAGQTLGKQLRDDFHKENRRVLLYLFKPGTVFDAKEWPCPAATGNVDACVKRSWSNGVPRREGAMRAHARRFGRAVPDAKRELVAPTNPAFSNELGREETTFACRFYHGLAIHSPCERDLKMWIVRLQVDGVSVDRPGQPAKSAKKIDLANRRFVARMGTTRDAPTIRGRTTDKGRIGLPVFEDTVSIDLRVDAFSDPALEPKDPTDLDTQPFADEGIFVPLTLSGGVFPRLRNKAAGDFDFDEDFDQEDAPTQDEVQRAEFQRLHNLGYGTDDTGLNFSKWDARQRRFVIERFQRDHSPPLTVTGTRSEAFDIELFREYGG